MGGARRHLSGFFRELDRQDESREYVALVRESFPDLPLQGSVRLEKISDSQAMGWMARVKGDIFDIPRKLRREKFGAIVSLTNFGPVWSPAPHILFQTNSLYFCRYHLSTANRRQKTETILRRGMVIEMMKRADVIVTPSDTMGEMIRDTCPQLDNRVFRTLYHGFDQGALEEPLDRKYEEMFARRHLRFLYPTHPAPHKGFEILFEMLSLVKKKMPNFTLYTTIEVDDWPEVVRPYEMMIRELGLDDHVVFMGRVPQGQMGALYRASELMIYPSLCESFGFSMVEAMAYGLPIVAAGTSVNQEICKGGALYYPPLDPHAGAEAILGALDPKNAGTVVERGRERMASFDWGWNRYAREFIGLINAVGC
ncbi:MAG: glycosyltransferase [Nitrospirae bacterium]|nr:glycosyltransferase [Nitrospirota bacterium]